MATQHNPLKQYFRRPTIYIKLPSGGKNYGPGVINMPANEELPVYPMTAIDEITTRTPDALFNGSAVADLITSCVPNITDPWSLNNIDLDAVLIGIRTAAGGNKIEIQTTCPKCTEDAIFDVNLVGLLNNLNIDSYDKELVLGELTFKFRPLTYQQVNEISTSQFQVQKIFERLDAMDTEEKNIKIKEALILTTNLTMDALSKTIQHIKTPTAFVEETDFILEFLQNLDKNDFTKIKDYNVELKQSSEMKPLHITCIHCKHEYDQTFTLNISDFFG
jgi:hypothetical protein